MKERTISRITVLLLAFAITLTGGPFSGFTPKVYAADASVASFEEFKAAIEAAETGGNDNTITITDSFTINETIAIDGKKITIVSADDVETTMEANGKFTITNGSEVTFQNTNLKLGTRTTSAIDVNNSTLVLDKFEMSGANVADENLVGLFNVSSSAIDVKNNTNIHDNVGRIFYLQDCKAASFKDSEFKNNDYSAGVYDGSGRGTGGVILFRNTDAMDKDLTFKITNCTFEKNKANQGGAVAVFAATNASGEESRAEVKTTLKIEGSTFKENHALGNRGGAILFYQQNGYLELSDYKDEDQKRHQTVFDGNVCEKGRNYSGGAIFIGPGYLTMSKASIHDNTAAGSGGGISTCRTGSHQVGVPDGVAVFNNKALGEVTSSYFPSQDCKNYPDVYAYTISHTTTPDGGVLPGLFDFPGYEFFLYERMFNDALHQWETKFVATQVDTTPDGQPRYMNSLVAKSNPTSTEGLDENANVIFINNKVEGDAGAPNPSGGAIGCNGLLQIGSVDNTEVKIFKLWDDAGKYNETARPTLEDYKALVESGKMKIKSEYVDPSTGATVKEVLDLKDPDLIIDVGLAKDFIVTSSVFDLPTEEDEKLAQIVKENPDDTYVVIISGLPRYATDGSGNVITYLDPVTGEEVKVKLTYTAYSDDINGYTSEADGRLLTNHKAEIEKYVKEAVHADIKINDKFTYNILAYVTNDADKVVVTDKLNEQLKFVSKASDVKVYDLGVDEEYEQVEPKDGDNPSDNGWYEKNASDEYVETTDTSVEEGKKYYQKIEIPISSNHLPVYDVSGNPIDNGDKIPSVKTGKAITIKNNDYSKVTINGDTLTVLLANKLKEVPDPEDSSKTIWVRDDTDQELKDLQGHYIRIEFEAELSDKVKKDLAEGKYTIDDLDMEEIKDSDEEDRDAPNVGNDPVVSEEDHKGIINNASYTIGVGNKAEAYTDKSNTVTVKPEQPEIEKYVNQAVHKDIGMDEEFTYDIIAYITNDAESVTIRDTLNEKLEFAGTYEDIEVVDLGKENNHKITNNIDAVQVNKDATVAEAGEKLVPEEITLESRGMDADGKVVEPAKLTVAFSDVTKATGDGKSVNLRGHWIRIRFTAKLGSEVTLDAAKKAYDTVKANEVYKDSVSKGNRAEPKVGNAPVLSNEDHTGIPNTASYEIEIDNKVKYEDTSNTVTVKVEEAEIEKYVNKAVHKELHAIDEVFTYDIIAYVTKDADSVSITDTLDDVLRFSGSSDTVKVEDLGTSVNHKPKNNINAKQVNKDASVGRTNGKSVDGSEVTIIGQTLTVDIPDAKAYRGHWIRVTFNAKIKKGATYSEITGAYDTVNPNKVHSDSISGGDRAKPNVGNDPVLSKEKHKGIPNTAEYTIKVGNEVKYGDVTNTVTVKPDDDVMSEFLEEDEDEDEEVEHIHSANTGDHNYVGIWMLMLIAAMSLLVIMRYRRRDNL